ALRSRAAHFAASLTLHFCSAAVGFVASPVRANVASACWRHSAYFPASAFFPCSHLCAGEILAAAAAARAGAPNEAGPATTLLVDAAPLPSQVARSVRHVPRSPSQVPRAV